MSEVGIVISLEGSPSTYEFSFVVDPKNKNMVKKGKFVQTESEEGTVFGYIQELTRANRYFERAESVAEYERAGSMGENFPISEWEYLIARTKTLGTFVNGKFTANSLPPYPGSKVKNADENMLRKFLGFQESGGIHIGKLQHHEINVNLDLTKLLQKHVAILAMSGAGKSHLSAILIEELLNREEKDGRIAIVVVDIHGEYIGFKSDPKYGRKVKIVEGNNIKIPFRSLGPNDIFEWFPESTLAGRSVLTEIMKDMRREMRDEQKMYGLQDLNERILRSSSKPNIMEPLRRMIQELRGYRIISKKQNPKLAEDVKAGEMLILDLSDLDNMKKKRMIVSYIAKKLFSLRKKEKIPPFLFLVEEAHNFATEKLDKYSNISKPVIEKIAREGRKFGACLCLISQRPVNLSTTALSQCNTHIILRITNPNDLRHIEESSEGIDSRMLKSITSLNVGEGIIVGEATKHPIFVEIRDRTSRKVEKGEPLADQARKFEEREKKKRKDVEAFL